MINYFKEKKARGSASLEYLVMVAAVISIVVVFLGPHGIFESALKRTHGLAVNGMTDMASRLSQSLTPTSQDPYNGGDLGGF